MEEKRSENRREAERSEEKQREAESCEALELLLLFFFEASYAHT